MMNDGFGQFPVGDWGTQSPRWMQECRRRACGVLESLPMPTRLNEEWRFGDRSRADVSGYRIAPRIASAEADVESWLPSSMGETIRIVFLNGELVEIPAALPSGLEVTPLASLDEVPACSLCRDGWTDMESNRFVMLNLSNLSSGILIRTSPGARIPQIVELVYAVRGEQAAIFPHTVIELGGDSRLQLLERHVGLDDVAQLSVALQSVNCRQGAGLDYALLQELGRSGASVELGRVLLEAGARIGHFSSHRGAEWSRQELSVSLTGREARAEILSANMLGGNQSLDQRTFQDHRSPGCYSNLLYKNVLDDAAKSVFSGMIKVEQGAHETDAYQSNRNLVLSGKAEVDSMPGLEILADNVRCSHGSATSGIDPEETFYLRSRGIGTERAERMIAEGFLNQALASFESEAMIRLLQERA